MLADETEAAVTPKITLILAISFMISTIILAHKALNRSQQPVDEPETQTAPIYQIYLPDDGSALV